MSASISARFRGERVMQGGHGVARQIETPGEIRPGARRYQAEVDAARVVCREQGVDHQVGGTVAANGEYP